MLPRDFHDGPDLLHTRIKLERAAPGELFDARKATPFAVLGIRTAGELVTRIEYLPRGAATLDPTNKAADAAARDDPVAGNHQRQAVRAAGAADRPRRAF